MCAKDTPQAKDAAAPEVDPFAYKEDRPPIPPELQYDPRSLSDRKSKTMRNN